MEEPREISKSSRVILWFAAWGVALAATPIPVSIAIPGLFPCFVMYIWAFPIGTAAFAFPEHWNPPDGVVVASLVGGWLFYIALTVVGLYQKRRVRYFTVYAILCLLLILNVVGCNVNMMKGEWHV